MKTILAISGRGLNFANYVKTLQNNDCVYTIESLLQANEILDHLRDSKVHLVTGLGGTRGTGLIADVAAKLKQHEIDFTVYVTLPFSFEGKKRGESAKKMVDHLLQNGFQVLTEDNNTLLTTGTTAPDSFKTAFFEADKRLYETMEA